MWNRLIFLFDVPALKNDVKKFSLDELLECGRDVTIADLSPYLNSWINESTTADRFDDDRFTHLILSEKAEIERFILQNRDAFFFPMFDNYYETRSIYRMLARFNITYGYVNNAMTDLVLKAEVEDSEDYATDHTAEHYKKAFYHRIGRYIGRRKPAEFIVFGGTAGEDTHFKNCECREGYTRRVHLWTYNYEQFARTESYDNGGRPYAVFLDQYMPFHQDVVIRRGAHIDPDLYFSELREVFDHVKKEFGLDIIIAAHPRSDYRGREDYYGDAKITYGVTSELIKGADIIFSNSSGANASAVIVDKPIVLINRSATQGYAHATNLFEEYVRLLGCSAIREKEDIETIDYHHIDREAYENFWKLYVMSAPQKSEKSFWEEVLAEVDR